MAQKLMTKALAGKLPALYAQDGKGMDAIAYAHYFVGGCDWYFTEFDPAKGVFFGWAVINGDMQNAELGYTSLAELAAGRASITVNGRRIHGAVSVERDMYWTSKTLKACKAECEVKYGRR